MVVGLVLVRGQLLLSSLTGIVEPQLLSERAVAELKAPRREAELERFRAELADGNTRVTRGGMDRQPPAIVRAYREVYARNPRGWPPA
jgi:hypothetical protein